MKRTSGLAILVLFAALLLGACGSGNETAAPKTKGEDSAKSAKGDETAAPKAKEESNAKSGETAAKPVVVRIGHFPNITHAQGLVGHYMTTHGQGWFEDRLGPNVKVEWYVYNAGPTAMEAVLTKAIDASYVGPNPALNAYIQSGGSDVRVVAGSATGGAALVVHADGNIAKPEDFRGKKIATPQFGNTQDVACRAWLAKQGFKVTKTGGDVSVVPTNNPDQLPLFAKGDIDAVWTVEPWVSRLEMEAKGKVFLEEEGSLTTVLTCGTDLLAKQPALAKKLVQAHRDLTEWIVQHPEEAQKMVTAELGELTHSDVAPALVEHAWKRLTFTADVEQKGFDSFLEAANAAGFLTEAGDIGKLVEKPQ